MFRLSTMFTLSQHKIQSHKLWQNNHTLKIPHLHKRGRVVGSLLMRSTASVCVCVCMHSYVSACLCLHACDVMCVWINVWHLFVLTKKRGQNSRLLLNLIPGSPFTMFSISLYDDIRRKEASQKEEFANCLYLSNTF